MQTAPAAIQNDRNVALSKLNGLIEAGRERLARGMTALNEEFKIRRDFMIRPDALDVSVVDNEVRAIFQDTPYDLTQHSRSQLLARAEVPERFASNLIDRQLGDLLRTNLRTLLPVTSPDGMLVRTVGPVARGILSAAYRRMDASPVFEAYIEQSIKEGLVPHSGEVTDTRAFASFLRQEVVEIAPGEFVALGTELRASDYGRGALEFNVLVVRLLCSNGMIGMDLLRKVHLGRRFDSSEFGGGNVIELSSRTRALDVRTVRSAVQDTVRSAGRYTTGLVDTLRAKAADTTLALPAALAALTRKGLRREVVDRVKTTYEQVMPVEAVPQEPGAWRFANVLSLLAHSASGDEAHDLQEAAFEVMVPGGRAA